MNFEAPRPIVMRLSYAELSMASHIAIMRRASNTLRNIQPKHGASNGEGSWEWDINSCCCELAVARYLNLFWCGTVNDFDARDVGGLVDVRSTIPSRRLMLHPDDPDETPFVLAWTRMPREPTFALIGWLFAREGKLEKYWCDPTGDNRPAFFVPPNHPLHDIRTLRDWADDQHRAVALVVEAK